MKSKNSRATGKEIGTFFDRYDLFGTPMQSFNIEGNEQVGTSIGCIFSCILTATVLLFAYTKG